MLPAFLRARAERFVFGLSLILCVGILLSVEPKQYLHQSRFYAYGVS